MIFSTFTLGQICGSETAGAAWNPAVYVKQVDVLSSSPWTWLNKNLLNELNEQKITAGIVGLTSIATLITAWIKGPKYAYFMGKYVWHSLQSARHGHPDYYGSYANQFWSNNGRPGIWNGRMIDHMPYLDNGTNWSSFVVPQQYRAIQTGSEMDMAMYKRSS